MHNIYAPICTYMHLYAPICTYMYLYVPIKHIEINKVPIKQVKHTQFLGVIFDDRLEWSTHINIHKY